MAVTLTFTVLGREQIARALSRFGDGIKDYKPAWDKIHASFLLIEQQQFASQGSRGGKVWPPLSPDYAAWKEMWFSGMPILQLFGRLFGAMTGGPGLAVIKEPMTLRMRPDIPYAAYHQGGTSRMPARPIIALTEADKMEWVKILHNYIYDKAKEARLL